MRDFNVTSECVAEAHSPAACGVTGLHMGSAAAGVGPSVAVRGEDGAVIVHQFDSPAAAVNFAGEVWLAHLRKAEAVVAVRAAEEAWHVVARQLSANTKERNRVVKYRPAPGPERTAYEAQRLAPLLQTRDRLRVEMKAKARELNAAREDAALVFQAWSRA